MYPRQSNDDSYVKRGGWVIGVGLARNDAESVPVYWDAVRYKGMTRRGGVFWRSFDWVHAVLEKNILPLFPHNKNVNATIDAIAYMIREETQSGAPSWVVGSDIGKTARELYRPECLQAFGIFNQSAPLPESLKDTLRSEVEPILFEVLSASFKGVERCLGYMKNSGRELYRMWPELLKQQSELFYVARCA